MRGMCDNIRSVIKSLHKVELWNIHLQSIFPEFNPKYLEAKFERGYWWDISDNISRMRAFDILISLYSTDSPEKALGTPLSKLLNLLDNEQRSNKTSQIY